MDKKTLLIHLLERLRAHRPMAEGILLLIQKQEFDDQLIDGILHIIADALRSTKSLIAQKKLRASQTILKKIKEQEQRHLDEDDAELLLAQLDDDGA